MPCGLFARVLRQNRVKLSPRQKAIHKVPLLTSHFSAEDFPHPAQLPATIHAKGLPHHLSSALDRYQLVNTHFAPFNPCQS
jgi:hypothetical protein